MSNRIRFAPVPPCAAAPLKPDVARVYLSAWVGFVRAALASADNPRGDYMKSKLRADCIDALRCWMLPFADRHANEVLGALPHLVRAFCHQPNGAARAALSEGLRSWALRCCELLDVAPTDAPAAPSASEAPSSPSDWRVRAGIVD